MTHVTQTSYDFIPGIIVPVIASFDSEGHVKPLYIRINQESFKVHSSWMKPSFSGVVEYHCQIEDHGILKPVLIKYHQAETVWTIPKTGTH